MSLINVGARISGQRPRSRNKLRAALRDSPERVTFDAVAGRNAGKIFTADPRSIGGRQLLVTGPFPGSVKSPWKLTIEARCAHLTVDIPVEG